jgi:aldehyde:ferredoxin oxidoreductase
MLGYDHELIYAMGSMLGIDDVTGMLQVIDEAELQGLDVMSTGVILAWATEALEKGLITDKETDGISLKWGDAPRYISAIQRIVSQPTEFYRHLAHGVDRAASVYGGEEFALSFGGNEMPGYHTGPGAHLGYLSGSRHSHLDSGGYSLDEKALKEDKTLTAQDLAAALLEEESRRQVLSSLVVCFFARNIYTPENISQALAAIGASYSPDDLDKIGRSILHEKYTFKRREGFDLPAVRIPGRILETPSSTGLIDRDLIEKTLKIMAEDYERMVPTRSSD